MVHQERLAQELVHVPVEILRAYKTRVSANSVYLGHADRPTTSCGFLILLRGQAEFCFNEQERYLLRAGDGFIGGLDKTLTLRTGHEETEYFLFHYMPSHHTPSETPLLTEVSPFFSELDHEVHDLLERAQSAGNIPGMLGQLELKSLFYRLAAKIMRTSRITGGENSYPLIQDAITFMHEHYNEKLTLDSLARRYGMSGKYFSHVFQKQKGTGPIEYLIQYRMKRAEVLLCTLSVPVHEIAEMVGYADANYFCRMFKKHVGVSPSAFRKANGRL